MLSLNAWNIIWIVVNLLVLYLIFKKFLFQPVLNVIKAREDLINEQLENAKKTNEDALEKKKNYEEQLSLAKGEADKIIMEARERSGSLITADLALEQGKEVYALPGPVDSPLSTGCNRLIQQGAGVLLSAENLLNEWGIMPDNLCRKTEIKPDKNKKTLESEDELVYSCVGLYPKNVEHLVLETGLEIRKLMRVLVSLELQGYIKEVSKNYYIRR